jgi:hypothetical protein
MSGNQKAASEDTLALIHDGLARWALRLLSGELKQTVTDKDGKAHEVAIQPTASELAVIRAFLKDNEITCPPGGDTAMQELRRKIEDQRRARGASTPAPSTPFDPERDLPVQ